MAKQTTRTKRFVASVIAKLRGYNNLVLLAVAALTITAIILGVSLLLYKVSGTAQLDLSRPGYETAREKSGSVKPDEFSATGDLNEKVVEGYYAMFDARAQRIKDVDAFSADTLSDSSFGIAE